jgi:UDP-N-acetylglucosamine enolpyruvyl transferase
MRCHDDISAQKVAFGLHVDYLQADGKSIIHETLYENRFQYLQELRKMGADIEITDPHRALIFGKTVLIGEVHRFTTPSRISSPIVPEAWS